MTAAPKPGAPKPSRTPTRAPARKPAPPPPAAARPGEWAPADTEYETAVPLSASAAPQGWEQVPEGTPAVPSYPAYPQASPWPSYPTYTYPPPQPMAKPWENFPPWLKRILRYYLYGLVGALIVVGLLYIVNIFIPLPEGSIGRAAGNLGLLMLGWLWGILSAWMMAYKPLVPAGGIGMVVGVATIVFGTLAIWDLVGGYELGRIPWAIFILQVVAAAAVAPIRAALRNEHGLLVMVSLACAAVGALMMSASILWQAPNMTPALVPEKLGESGAGLAFPMCLAGTLVLMPNRPRLNLTRWFAFAGFAELAFFLAVKPWIAGSAMIERMTIAMWALAIILGLVAATFLLLDVMGLRRDPAATPAGRMSR